MPVKQSFFGIMIFPPIVALKYVYLDLFDHFPAIQVPVLIKPSSILITDLKLLSLKQKSKSS